MTLTESYNNHKSKLIKNAARIEAAINQLTNLKKAENFVMTGEEHEVVHNKLGDFELPEGTLNRDLHGNAHVCRFDSLGHAEYYYISFSAKQYYGAEAFKDEDTYWILSKSQLRNTKLLYILLTDTGIYTAKPEQFKLSKRTGSLQRKYWKELEDNEEHTYMNFKYLQKVTPNKEQRVTGSYKVTFVLPSGNELTYESDSMRSLYTKIFNSQEFSTIDAISYNTFMYHFNKGSDWVIKKGDKKIIAKFECSRLSRATRDDKRVKNLGEIEKEIEEFEESNDAFFETQSCTAFSAEVVNRYLHRFPEEYRIKRSLWNYLRNPALWNTL